MEFVVVLTAVVVAGIGFITLYQARRRSRVKRLALLWVRYMELRQQSVAGQGTSRAFANAADDVVRALGPKFDPRTPGWERLELLEPNLRAFVTRYVDTTAEVPPDLEAFAESILRLEVVQFRGITQHDWLKTIELFVSFAAQWRLKVPIGIGAGSSTSLDEAMRQSAEVASRMFRFAEWHWDRKRNAPVDRMGRPAPGRSPEGQRQPVAHPIPSRAVAQPIQTAPTVSSGRYGPNSAQVEQLVHALSVLTVSEIEWVAASYGFLKDHRAVEPLTPDVEDPQVVKAGFDRIVRLPLAAPDLPTLPGPMAIRAGANAILTAIDNTGLEPPPNVRVLAPCAGAHLGLLVAARPEADPRDFDNAWRYYTDRIPRLRTCLT